VSNREQAESAAAGWIARRERDDWSPADQEELEQWMAASMHNRVAWLRVRAAWQETQRLNTVLHDAPAGTVPSPEQIRLPYFDAGRAEHAAVKRNTTCSRPTLRPRAIVACVLLICATATAWRIWQGNFAYETDVGAVEAIPLADGSKVTLNTDSRISVDLNQHERRINLGQGEAYFEVTKDSQRPFVVWAGDERIVAVGTRFSVRRDGEAIRVMVTEGTVRVEPADAAAVPAMLLQAGTVARAVGDGVVIHQKPLAELEQLLTWRTGYLAFDRTALAEAVAEFNRYNRRKIQIADPAIATIRIGGYFRATNVDAFLRLIESDFPIVSSVTSDRITLRLSTADNR
jgi:transmembrane sensor